MYEQRAYDLIKHYTVGFKSNLFHFILRLSCGVNWYTMEKKRIDRRIWPKAKQLIRFTLNHIVRSFWSVFHFMVLHCTRAHRHQVMIVRPMRIMEFFFQRITKNASDSILWTWNGRNSTDCFFLFSFSVCMCGVRSLNFFFFLLKRSLNFAWSHFVILFLNLVVFANERYHTHYYVCVFYTVLTHKCD